MVQWVYVWVGIGVVAALITALYLYKRFVPARQPRLKGPCQHRWLIHHAFVLENTYPRLAKVCKKCNVAIHVPIYTLKQLRALEEG